MAEPTLKIDNKRQIFHGNFCVLSGFLCRKSAERNSPKKYFYLISFSRSLSSLLTRGLTSLTTYYLLDYADLYSNPDSHIPHTYIIGHYNPLVKITTYLLTTIMRN